jgi:Na+/H+ antiporter NhaD/arsenite permease-like protein
VASLGPLWGLPFAGLLLSIALGPLVAPRVWHHHFGKIAAVWALALLLPWAQRFGVADAGHVVAHALLAEYLPFTILVGSLYTIAGGLYLRGNLRGSPTLNAGLMAVGALLANLMGTTGASLVLVQPLLRANDDRPHNAHVFVFFIFIVGNVGGALTPLGDPPLFLGFLQGVSFFWTAEHLWLHTLALIGLLLAVFWLLDAWFYRREGHSPRDPTPDDGGLGLEGAINLLPLLLAVGLVLLSGFWRPGVSVALLGVEVPLQAAVRDLGLLVAAGLSLWLTPVGVRAKNRFGWEPLKEVAQLFAGIFITMAPVLVMLQSGAHGPFASLQAWLTGADGQPLPAGYFWLTGALSSFLDNAPTYLAFFSLAGGDAGMLMQQGAAVLAAISAGAVFMGAMSYVGNAPNFMVKAIAESRGVKMPGFFGYLAWSCAVLLPLLLLVSLIGFS